jgi:hypothetical protein
MVATGGLEPPTSSLAGLFLAGTAACHLTADFNTELI